MTKVNWTDLEMLDYTEGEMVGHSVWKFNNLTNIEDIKEVESNADNENIFG